MSNFCVTVYMYIYIHSLPYPPTSPMFFMFWWSRYSFHVNTCLHIVLMTIKMYWIELSLLSNCHKRFQCDSSYAVSRDCSNVWYCVLLHVISSLFLTHSSVSVTVSCLSLPSNGHKKLQSYVNNANLRVYSKVVWFYKYAGLLIH